MPNHFQANGGTYGPDNSRYTTYRAPVYRTNDYSQHTTHHGGYVNYGQHANQGGSINNFAPQTTNHGPIYGYRQHFGPIGGSRRRPQPSSPPDFDNDFNAPPPNPRTGQQYRPRHAPQGPQFVGDPAKGGPASDGDVNNDEDEEDDSSGDEDQLPPRPRAQLRTAPAPRRPRGEQPTSHDDSIDEGLRNLSPEMQRYIQMLTQQRNGGGAPVPPVRPETDLHERLAGLQLDEPEPPRRPTGLSSPRAHPQNPPRRDMNASPRGTGTGARGPPPARFSEPHRENPAPEEYESDEDSVPLPAGTVIRNTDSNNVNSTTVVDSHNDNSTRTEISKAKRAR